MRQPGLVILLVVALAVFVAIAIVRQHSGKSPVVGEVDLVADVGNTMRPSSSPPAVAGDSPVDSVLIEECRSRRPGLDDEQYAAKLEAYYREAAATLSGSGNAEHLAAAALLSGYDSKDFQPSRLATAAAQDPGNPLVAWIGLLICLGPSGKNCEVETVVGNTLEIDGSNGAVWIEVANLRLRQGDEVAAAQAARRAVAAPRFDRYFIETVLLVDRSLLAVGDSTYTDRIFTGMGFAAQINPAFGEFYDHCRQVDPADAMWVDLCDQIGAKMLFEGGSLLDKANGVTLQKVAAGHSGDERRLAAAVERESAYTQHIRHLMDNPHEQALLENDETILKRYVDDFATYGEMEAQVRLHAEAERLQDSPDYDKCNFVPRTVPAN